jgi:lactose/cellobiose-specific phosphotransferase system IIC component
MHKTPSSDWLKLSILELADRLGNRPFFLSVQRGLALALPLIMIGALALLVKDFPLPALQDFLDGIFGTTWRLFCENLIAGSFGIASLAVLCAFSGVMTALENQRNTYQVVSPTMAMVIVLSCFFVVSAPGETASWRPFLSLDRGMMAALVVGATATTLYLRLCRLSFLRLPFGAVGHDPVVRDVLTVMPAGVLTILAFALIRLLFVAVGAVDLHEQLRHLLAIPFVGAGDSLGAGLAYSGLSQLFWFFGVHGPNLLFSVEEHILVPAGAANALAHTFGGVTPHIFTKAFFDAFTRMGGSGCTLCLILAVLLRSQDKGNRKLCLFALLPALCNVNEPLLFGIPLVLNPVYMIPFLLTPLLQTLLAFIATAFDFLPRTVGSPAWTSPALLSGFVATGSLAGPVMQVVNLMLGTLVYLPFVQLSDQLRSQQGKRMLDALAKVVESRTVGSHGRQCLDRPGEEGRIAKILAHDLERALQLDDQLFLVYQPQMNAIHNQVHGVEALLRWRHPVFGFIPPPVIIALAEDTAQISRLGHFILTEACSQRAAWKSLVADDLVMSVNVTPRQILDPYFDRRVADVLKEAGLLPTLLEVEITESTILEPDAPTLAMLRQLRQTGVRVSIDDFGMGHTSLRYLREFPVDTVKLDRSLTYASQRGINDHIVHSIVELSHTLGFMTVVEGVEEPEQLTHFLHLGCSTFQGYLFSRPVSGEDCLRYIRDRIMEAGPTLQ